MLTNGLVAGCVICQLTAASSGVGQCKHVRSKEIEHVGVVGLQISLLCVIVKLLMGFNCERWTDDMEALRNFFFHYPYGSLQSHNQCVVLFPTSIAHLSTASSASENTIPTTTTTTTTTTTVNNIPSVW
ncbi:conserved hypothetical protein [Trichinella spiralis]|uniref:hypothetical protein n=1 Tax=Trichinella spiralis TaxID=6334 RepID=UPI0001EFD475|nr:conserved hypothetical protein [Trichinella spiralis]